MLSTRGLKEPPCFQTFHSIIGKQGPGNTAIKCYVARSKWSSEIGVSWKNGRFRVEGGLKESGRDGSADALGQGGETGALGRPGLMGES